MDTIGFTYKEQPSTIEISKCGPTTTVLITVGDGPITIKNREERIYCGVSTCNSKELDKYDPIEGVKQACRQALLFSRCCSSQYERAIYREIRKALKEVAKEAQ